MKVPGPAASGLTSTWPASCGSRAKAQRLIDAGLVRVDGVVAKPKRFVLSGARRWTSTSPSPSRVADVPPAQFAIAYEDEHLLVDRQAGGGRGASGVGALRRGRSSRRWRAGWRADRPSGPASCTGSIATRPGCCVLAHGPSDVHAGADRRRCERARSPASTSALVEGRPPARRGTIDAPLGRDRRVRTRISTDTDDPHEAVTHFAVERALPDDTLLRVTLETGPDASDPSAPVGDRSSGCRGPGIRAARKSTA